MNIAVQLLVFAALVVPAGMYCARWVTALQAAKVCSPILVGAVVSLRRIVEDKEATPKARSFAAHLASLAANLESIQAYAAYRPGDFMNTRMGPLDLSEFGAHRDTIRSALMCVAMATIAHQPIAGLGLRKLLRDATAVALSKAKVPSEYKKAADVRVQHLSLSIEEELWMLRPC